MNKNARPIFDRFGQSIDPDLYRLIEKDLKEKPFMEVMEYWFCANFDPIHLKQIVTGILNLEMCSLGLKKAFEERDTF